jgi:hypothetical protein
MSAWFYDHAREEWVYGYLMPVGDLRDGTVAARLEPVTPPGGAASDPSTTNSEDS